MTAFLNFIKFEAEDFVTETLKNGIRLEENQSYKISGHTRVIKLFLGNMDHSERIIKKLTLEAGRGFI